MNRLTPALVLKHASLIKTGRYATLGRVYRPGIAFTGARGIRLNISGLPADRQTGDNDLIYGDETPVAETDHVGTQFDGPGHIGIVTSKGNWFYNGVNSNDADGGANRTGRPDVEQVAAKGYVCRGVLLDAAAYRGMDQLPVPKEGVPGDPGIITDKDIEGMLKRQGIAPLGEGDCVFLYTGHGNFWHARKWDTYDADEKARRLAAFNAGEPGFGISACQHMIAAKVVLTGADTWAAEAVPGESSDTPFPCHVQMQTRHGIWNLENLDLSPLVDDKAYEFLFVWAPLKMSGSTGSPGNPIAIY
ncbi:MAG: cyclase family protein [Pseudomonadota bacterium]